MQAIDDDPAYPARHAAWVRAGRVGPEPRPRWASAQAFVDLYRNTSRPAIERAFWTEIQVRARLGVAITDAGCL